MFTRITLLLALAIGCKSPTDVLLGSAAHGHPGRSPDSSNVEAGPGAPPASEAGASSTPQARDTLDLPLLADFDPSSCPELDLQIDPRRPEEYESDRGVLLKVLQAPAFTAANRAQPETDAGAPPKSDPSRWDRAEFPEGACVVRLRGLQASCYANPDSLAVYHAPPDAGGSVVQASFHARRWSQQVDLCDWPVPGCPTAEWGTFSGYWWYLSPRQDDTLLVICAASCAGFFAGGAELQLRTHDGPGLCAEP